VWASAYALYIAEVFFVLSYEKEDTPGNLFIIALMYFTYCQLWIYVVFKSLWLDFTKTRVGVWDKTVRFNTDGDVQAPESGDKVPETGVKAAESVDKAPNKTKVSEAGTSGTDRETARG